MDYYKQHPEKKRLTDKKYAAGHRAIKRASHKKWADKNKEKAKLSNKTWFQKVKERQRLRLRAWREENPELVKAAALRQRTRAKLNPANRIAGTMSRTVGRCLRGMKGRRRWETLVGYSLEELRSHLEKKFTNKMNWANYGSYWHIDHIVPLSVFNFERMENIDFKRCWALSNLQPLEKIENIKKGNRLTQAFQPALLIEDRYFENERSFNEDHKQF